MAVPRRVLPGSTYFTTRRCVDRRYLLRPSKVVDEILEFALAVAAKRFGIEVHSYVFMSNHYHMLLTDPRGLLPRFEHLFHSLVARFLNAFYGRFESFWAPGSYSAIRITDAETYEAYDAYLGNNPVKGGLVARASDWPGLISFPEDLADDAKPLRVHRPKFFFSPRTRLPKVVELKLTCPPMLLDRPRDEVIASLRKRREEGEEAARRKIEQQGRKFLGQRGVLEQSPFERPRNREPRFRLSPSVASRDRASRIAEIEELKWFRIDYRDAYVEYRNGNKSVVFPEGTWGPVELYGARARGAPRPRPRAA